MIRFSFTSTESIKFTCETEKGYQLSPFLIHTLIPWLKSGFLKSTVSRKPTHRSIFAFQFASPFATQVHHYKSTFTWVGWRIWTGNVMFDIFGWSRSDNMVRSIDVIFVIVRSKGNSEPFGHWWYLQGPSQQQLMGMVLIDLSEAFNSICHSTFHLKLCSLATSSQALKWFESYLTDRKQSTRLGTSLSEELTITHGMPQGS